jgi:uncharacterized protein YecE (DUF72 family)
MTAGRILVGTSGYSYGDWRGPFYPAGLPRAAYLDFYRGHFPVCELNFTYYRAPTAAQLGRLLAASQGQVTFTLKLPGALTHQRAGDPGPGVEALHEAVVPLVEAGVLGAVLAQFPQSFRPGPAASAYLHALLDRLRPLPTVVELRSAAWVGQDTFDDLRRRGVAWCAVDEPELPGLTPRLPVVTASPGYVRFHGRRTDTWHRHEQAHERYDYAYADTELREWVPRLRRMAERAPVVYVMFNNHFQAKAVTAAKRLRELLAG